MGVSTDHQDLFVRMRAVAALAHVIGNGFYGSLPPTPNAQGVTPAL